MHVGKLVAELYTQLENTTNQVLALSSMVDELTEQIANRDQEIDSMFENLTQANAQLQENSIVIEELQRQLKASKTFNPDLLRVKAKAEAIIKLAGDITTCLPS